MGNYRAIFFSGVLGALALGVPQISWAEDAKVNPSAVSSNLEWNGYFDFYYQNSPQAHAASPATPAGPAVVEGRYFDRHSNQMTVNMVELSLKKKAGKVAFRADLAMGEMVDQLNGGGSQSVTTTSTTNTAANEPTRNLTQATLTYAASDRLSFTAGKFYTPMGLEVTKAKDNWQYSRSYTFNYAIPFWHQGIYGTYVLSPGQWATTVYLLNAWDGRNSQEANKTGTIGFNLNFTGVEGLAVNYNYLGGGESTDQSHRTVHEINATYAISPAISIATDYVIGTQKDIPVLGDAKWSGLAVYLKAAINDFYTLSPRYEIFDDSNNGFAIAGGLGAAGTKQKITSWTLSNIFQLGEGLETRVELRSDSSDSDQFFKDKDGATSNRQDSYSVSFLYNF